MKKKKDINVHNEVFVLMRRIQRARTEADRDIAKNNFMAMKDNKIACKFVKYVEETFLSEQWINSFCDMWRQSGNIELWNTNNASEATIRTIQSDMQ